MIDTAAVAGSDAVGIPKPILQQMVDASMELMNLDLRPTNANLCQSAYSYPVNSQK